jgi:hypothetical protein
MKCMKDIRYIRENELTISLCSRTTDLGYLPQLLYSYLIRGDVRHLKYRKTCRNRELTGLQSDSVGNPSCHRVDRNESCT